MKPFTSSCTPCSHCSSPWRRDARQAFGRLLVRGLKDPSIALDAVENAGDALPWQPEWSDLLVKIAEKSGPEERCRVLDELEKRV